jgi:iron complex outermembrane receptor protein
MKIVPALLLVPAVLARAATPAATGGDAPVTLPEFFVTSDRIGALELVVPRGDLRPPEPNLGQELLAIPGVYSQARAVDAMEPNLRGLGLDRVATTINGIPLLNASPERTNSPVVILGPAAVSDITVVKALPSVTLGPATTGGRVVLSTTEPAEKLPAAPYQGSLNLTYNGARDGFTSRGRFAAAAGAWSADATFFHNDLSDYTAPDGRVVAARLAEAGASFALGWRGAGHEARAELLARRLRREDTLSLPLDGRDTDSQVFTFNDRWTRDQGPLQKLEWRVGHTFTDPYITSAARPVPALSFAQATARSTAAGLDSRWRLGEDATLALGGDWSHQQRRAVRTTAAGLDFIWPDAVYDDAGVFAEWNRALGAAWNLRLGARADQVRSDARDADRLALGRPIREQFVSYNGPAAAVTARDDVVGAVNALLKWTPRRGLSAFVGAGVSDQPAQAMERYRAMLNALGGDGRGGNAVELGNPALGAERKWALEAGGSWESAAAEFQATLYYYRVDDFILRTAIGKTLPPLANMVVFGYRNIDAELYGGEFGIALKPSHQLSLPLTFAFAEGRDRAHGTGLSEIPPWEATLAARFRSEAKSFPLWTEVGLRLAGAKTNPAPLDNPLFTSAGGFALWHLRAGVPLGRHLRVEAGVENIFNRAYIEYLSPPVGPFKPASGTLLPGDRIPGPRRSLWLSTTLKF